MLFSITLFQFLLCVLSKETSYNQLLWLEESKPVNICCSWKPTETEVLFLINDRNRIQALVVQSESGQVQRHRVDERKFLLRHPGWTVDSLTKPDAELCVHKESGARLETDDNMTFICVAQEDRGLGPEKYREEIRIKIFKPVDLIGITGPSSVKEGDAAQFICKASGFPGLEITWRSKSTDKELAKTMTPFNIGDGQLTLELPSVAATQHGELLECEAQTSYPVDRKSSRAQVKLEVLLPPKINVSAVTIYTKVGGRESFEITVTGYPTPHLICEDLPLEEPREISKHPQGGKHVYSVVIENINENHLKTFVCTATNTVGTTGQVIQLTGTPSEPELLSPNSTHMADYYMLNWKAHSRLPLENVTVELNELDPNEFDQVVSSRKIVYPLQAQQVHDVRTSVWFPLGETEAISASLTGPDRWQHVAWHHLANLSEDTEHSIKLTVCNQYACRSSVPAEKSSTFVKTSFRTAKFNGTNLVDPKILSQPPMESTRLHNQPLVSHEGEGGNSAPCRQLFIHSAGVFIALRVALQCL